MEEKKSRKRGQGAVRKQKSVSSGKRESASRKKVTVKSAKRTPQKKESGEGFWRRLFYRQGELSSRAIWTATVLIALLYLGGTYFFFFHPYLFQREEVELRFFASQVHGLDISHHQGVIDWEKLSFAAYKDYPINFVFMKATEGGDFVDTAFPQNFASARERGLLRGAYHFFLPQVSAELQAENFIRTVRLEPGDLPPVLDVEVLGDGGTTQLQQGVRVWLTRVEAHYGVRPIIYAGYKFKLKHLNEPFFDAYPYWIAHYYVGKLKYEGEWKFWQHTDMGQIEGVDGHVDLDIFNGSLEELMQMTVKEKKVGAE